MKWEGRRQSSNMEDRRGMGTTGKVVAGGGLIGIIVLLLNLFGGESAQNLTPILEQLQQQRQQLKEQLQQQLQLAGQNQHQHQLLHQSRGASQQSFQYVALKVGSRLDV